MIVYINSSEGFLKDVDTNKISDRIKEAYYEKTGKKNFNDKEESSWIYSLEFMGKIIRRSNISNDCGVMIEFGLPSTSKRIDFIVSGIDERGREACSSFSVQSSLFVHDLRALEQITDIPAPTLDRDTLKQLTELCNFVSYLRDSHASLRAYVFALLVVEAIADKAQPIDMPLCDVTRDRVIAHIQKKSSEVLSESVKRHKQDFSVLHDDAVAQRDHFLQALTMGQLSQKDIIAFDDLLVMDAASRTNDP